MIYQDNKGHRAHSRHTQLPWAAEEPRPRFAGIVTLVMGVVIWALVGWLFITC